MTTFGYIKVDNDFFAVENEYIWVWLIQTEWFDKGEENRVVIFPGADNFTMIRKDFYKGDKAVWVVDMIGNSYCTASTIINNGVFKTHDESVNASLPVIDIS